MKLRGKTMLKPAREVFRKVFFLSYAYHFSGEKQFAKRAIEELSCVSALKNWNPQVFLDLAELTMAMAIGYDWLNDAMTDSEKQLISKAIWEKGLEPSFDTTYNTFLKLDNNWNQVCNAAMVWGAVAVYEQAPEMAEKIISRALESSQLPMEKYGQNGVFPEGVMYWTYGTSFHVLMLESIKNLMENDISTYFSKSFLQSGNFFLHMTSNTGKAYNWSDALELQYPNPAIFWLAKVQKDPTLIWNQIKFFEKGQLKNLKKSRLLPAIILLGADISLNDTAPPQKKFWASKGNNAVVAMRSSWEDSNAIFVGLKLGNAREHHAHMDMGAFVMEAEGVRWSMDLGMQTYYSLSSQKVDLWNSSQQGGRWQVFRNNNYGHGTLTLDDSLQDVNGQAKLIRTGEHESFQYAIGDLTEAYLRKDRQIYRGVAIIKKEQAVIRDEIAASSKPVHVTWRMITPAKAQIKGKRITLFHKGKRLELVLMASEKNTIKVRPALSKNKYDAPNKGISMIEIEMEVPANKAASIQVNLQPLKEHHCLQAIPISLENWGKNTLPDQ
ncbi:heparinase II/III family protein [Echinicola sp. CAU 1574]|uniref:Heparinase II/III family protein n=1 Tax=Echinicola arenosa TaxID=2774144 RepID=A0ABR9AQ15_9BACT|nr:heparinase II/III family protein [Echinicola arenosa]MBD8490890.1 heparinase II/III family protein [Echinicola arenosa]